MLLVSLLSEARPSNKRVARDDLNASRIAITSLFQVARYTVWIERALLLFNSTSSIRMTRAKVMAQRDQRVPGLRRSVDSACNRAWSVDKGIDSFVRLLTTLKNLKTIFDLS